MGYLHDDREQFQDAIEITYEQTGIMPQIIEKDYYVTMLLRVLAEKIPYIVFKGGTSLSKCHKVIKRFGSIIFFVGLTLPRYSFSKPSASLDRNLRQCLW